MAGLRERKKAKTQDRILRSAIELFSENGYANTTMEQIAERAEVGVGTLYNYFGSKRALLVGFATGEHEEIEETGRRIIEKDEGDPVRAISDLFWTYFEHAVLYDKKLMRELTAASILEPDTLGKEMAELDYHLVAQVGRLITKHQELGVIDATIPVEDASMVIYGVFILVTIVFMTSDVDEDWVKETMTKHIGLIFRGWKERGERS
jgi:AcrR family transcriptional regulator